MDKFVLNPKERGWEIGLIIEVEDKYYSDNRLVKNIEKAKIFKSDNDEFLNIVNKYRNNGLDARVLNVHKNKKGEVFVELDLTNQYSRGLIAKKPYVYKIHCVYEIDYNPQLIKSDLEKENFVELIYYIERKADEIDQDFSANLVPKDIAKILKNVYDMKIINERNKYDNLADKTSRYNAQIDIVGVWNRFAIPKYAKRKKEILNNNKYQNNQLKKALQEMYTKVN